MESYTHGRIYDIIVSREFLGPDDKVLLIDDFMANGKAMEGLIQIVKDSGAQLVGAGIVIEKGFQPGGDALRDQGVHLESLAIVESMDEKTERSYSDKLYDFFTIADFLYKNITKD